MRRQNKQRIEAVRESIRCITFDLDDTLWECMPVIHRAEERFYHWLQQNHPEIPARYDYHSMIQSRIAFMQANQHHAFDLTRLRKAWLAQLADECGAEKEAVVDEGFHVFWEARNQVELFEGVRETLLQLKDHFLLGSITNGNADIERVGLGDCFDFSVTSAEAGVSKPEKAIFELAAEKSGVNLDQVLHVGDDSDRDVIGALQAGAMAAWITGEAAPQWCYHEPPQLVLSHVGELPSYLLATSEK